MNLIAITDHNACGNVEAVMEAARGTEVRVLAGMEVQTKEEVHLLCLFDRVEECRVLEKEVRSRLLPLPNKEELFGPQYLVNAEGEWVRTEGLLLAQSADWSLEEVIEAVNGLGGVAIPAHVDRPSYSLLTQLGLVPKGLKTSALEVTTRFQRDRGFQQWPELRNWCLVMNGDAHRLKDIQNRTLFYLEQPDMEEMKLAFEGRGGRKVVVAWPDETRASTKEKRGGYHE